MTKLSTILLISSFFIIISLLPLAYSKQQVTNIRLYLQDQFNESQPLAYGDVLAFQDPITMGPDPNSTLWGRAQGTVGFATHDPYTFDMHVSIAYIFIGGEYDGSTVIAVGRNDLTQSVREFAIVGGTGAFKLARGIVTGTPYSTVPHRVLIYDLEIVQDSDESSEIGIQKFV